MKLMEMLCYRFDMKAVGLRPPEIKCLIMIFQKYLGEKGTDLYFVQVPKWKIVHKLYGGKQRKDYMKLPIFLN